jgi:Tfp pilus assembly protein PilO
MTATRKWSALAVLLVAAIFAASWFGLIAPKRSDAAKLEADRVTQDATNAGLVQQLELLKAQAQDLPKQEAFLAQIRKQLPDNPALPALIRSLTQGAAKSGVDLISLSPALPIAVAGPIVAQTVAPPTTAPADQTSEEAVPVPAPAAPTLFQVPITVKVTGTYFEMEQFLNKVEGLKRSFLVTGFTLKSAPASMGSDVEKLNLEIKGRVFLSPAAAATAAASTATAPAVTSPSTAPTAN